MSRRIFLAGRGAGWHVAAWDACGLAAYSVIDPALPDRTGSVQLGRILRIDGALGAAMLELADGSEGLLPLAGGRRPAEGSLCLAQLQREQRGSKAARLTTAILLVGRALCLQADRPGIEFYPQMTRTTELDAVARRLAASVPAGQGILLRPSAAHMPVAALDAELERLLARWREISAKAAATERPQLILPAEDALDRLLRDLPDGEEAIVTCANHRAAEIVKKRMERYPEARTRVSVLPENQWSPSADELAEALDEALEERVALRGGGSLFVEAGRTLVAIDVDSGEAGSRHGVAAGADRVRREVNLAAAGEIGRQLRLRNLAGPIVIDFISMRRPADRRAVVAALRAACGTDAERCHILEMSPFGLVEMVREGGGPTLAEQLRSRNDEARASTARRIR